MPSFYLLMNGLSAKTRTTTVVKTYYAYLESITREVYADLLNMIHKNDQSNRELFREALDGLNGCFLVVCLMNIMEEEV